MTIKATSIAAVLGVAVASFAMAPVAMAVDQGFAPRPDFPGAKQQDPSYSQQQQLPPQATSPRPDFPGAKQSQQSGKHTGASQK
jgi:hypothetical protein